MLVADFIQHSLLKTKLREKSSMEVSLLVLVNDVLQRFISSYIREMFYYESRCSADVTATIRKTCEFQSRFGHLVCFHINEYNTHEQKLSKLR